MTEKDLEQMLERLRSRRLFDEIFVIVIERDNGTIRLLDYGMKEISEVSAWLAVQQEKQKQNQQKES